MKSTAATSGHPRIHEPTWEIAGLFPAQGDWSVEEYLALPDNRLIEFDAGRLEVLPMPTTLHQWVMFYLCRLLDAFASAQDLGLALPAPLRVRLWPGKFREPDVVFMRRQHGRRVGREYWIGADLVMEVLSDEAKDRRRDLVTKRREYARAGIREYWLVDPQSKTITVLRLRKQRYAVHGKYRVGQEARSHLLSGFRVDVSSAFAGPSLPRR